MELTKNQIVRAQGGDSIALDIVLQEAISFLTDFMDTHIDSPLEADDIVQETLIAVIEKLSRYDPDTEGFDNWVAGFAWIRINRWRNGEYICGKRKRSYNREIPFSDWIGDLILEDIEGGIDPDRIIK